MSLPSSTPVGDRVRLPLAFDVEAMRAEVYALRLRDFVYYDVMPLTTATRRRDAGAPAPGTVTDFADGTWADWTNTGALKHAPYLTSIVDQFRAHTRVTLVRLLRLEAGAVVKEHNDPTLGLEIERSVIRLTVPIISTDAVQFFLNSTVVPMQPGECWYLRLSDPHSIVNGSSETRVNMSIDMEPNDWVRELVQSGQDAAGA